MEYSSNYLEIMHQDHRDRMSFLNRSKKMRSASQNTQPNPKVSPELSNKGLYLPNFRDFFIFWLFLTIFYNFFYTRNIFELNLFFLIKIFVIKFIKSVKKLISFHFSFNSKFFQFLSTEFQIFTSMK